VLELVPQWSGEWSTVAEADVSNVDAIPTGTSLWQQLLVMLHIDSDGVCPLLGMDAVA